MLPQTSFRLLACAFLLTLGLVQPAASLNNASASAAAVEGAIPDDWIKAMHWRAIGPASMGGRITAISVFEPDPTTFYVATASGGLLKTENNGTTFSHQFDREATVSIGDVCVSQSNKNIVWVGTGENNPRNSVSFGDGVYKSIDGGKSWKNMGLHKSFQIGRIAIHPKNPDIVYVGALGRLYGPNPERGLFKTTDGGKTWTNILFIDNNTGVVDVQMHPQDPETMLVATWERQRDGFDSHRGYPKPAEGYTIYDPIKKWGKGSGLYKTVDGGKTFRKLTKGLPTAELGRMGFDYYRKNPNVIYLVLESERIGTGLVKSKPYLGVGGENAEGGVKLTSIAPNGAAAKSNVQVGDIVLGVDDKRIQSFEELKSQIARHKVGDKITLKVSRNRKLVEIAVILGEMPPESEFAKTRPYGHSMLGGQSANVQSIQGPNGFQTGGVYKSMDGGESWTRVNSLNPRPMYFSQIRVDPSDEKYVYVCGVDMHMSNNGGKTFHSDRARRIHPDHHALWIDPRDGRHALAGGDGGCYVTYDRMKNWDFLDHVAIGQFYHVTVDTRRPYRVYGGLQDNGTWGGPSRTRTRQGPVNPDWTMIGGGDGFVCRVDPKDPDIVYGESQDGHIYRKNLRTGESAGIHPKPREKKPDPVQGNVAAVLSIFGVPSFLPNVNQVKDPLPYRFNWNTPYILSQHNSSIFYCGGNHVFRSLNMGDNLKEISPEITRTKRGTATALSESPRNPDVLYVGSDDGAVWVTLNGGRTWTDLTLKFGMPGPRWVASIEASRYADGRAYIAFDGHRSDDDEPYLFVTEDFGKTWKPIRANLPAGSARVLREDVKNPDLLYAGTEFAIWASVNRGNSWAKINNNLPTVAIHEIAVHPTAGEIVVATHGRSLWILDVTPLQQIKPDLFQAPAHVFEPAPAILWRLEIPKGNHDWFSGHRHFIGENPTRGVHIYYSLGKEAKKASLKVVDLKGEVLQESNVQKSPGLHHIVWILEGNFLYSKPDKARLKPVKGERRVGPGTYRVILNVDDKEYSQIVRVEADPNAEKNAAAAGKKE